MYLRTLEVLSPQITKNWGDLQIANPQSPTFAEGLQI
jgi:hypothetical protein